VVKQVADLIMGRNDTGWTARLDAATAAVSRLAADNAALRAQLTAASDRYARAVADADEVRGRLVAELAEARGKALEEAVVTFPGEVVEILDDDKAPEMRLSIGEMGDEMLSPLLPGAKYGDKVEIVVRALAAPAAKGGA
jgi:hypothetical protein